MISLTVKTLFKKFIIICTTYYFACQISIAAAAFLLSAVHVGNY